MAHHAEPAGASGGGLSSVSSGGARCGRDSRAALLAELFGSSEEEESEPTGASGGGLGAQRGRDSDHRKHVQVGSRHLRSILNKLSKLCLEDGFIVVAYFRRKATGNVTTFQPAGFTFAQALALLGALHVVAAEMRTKKLSIDFDAVFNDPLVYEQASEVVDQFRFFGVSETDREQLCQLMRERDVRAQQNPREEAAAASFLRAAVQALVRQVIVQEMRVNAGRR